MYQVFKYIIQHRLHSHANLDKTTFQLPGNIIEIIKKRKRIHKPQHFNNHLNALQTILINVFACI